MSEDQRKQSDNIFLYQYEGNNTLSVCEPECLATEAYLRFARIKYQVFSVPQTPNDSLPLLKHYHNSKIGLHNIVTYLSDQGIDLWKNIPITKEQKAEAIAFTSLIEEKLGPAFIFYCWVADDKNYDQMKHHYFANSSFFSRWLFAPLLRRKYRDSLSRRYKLTCIEDSTKMVEECFDALEILLQNKSYFFGNKPTTFDAIAYGYLACIKYLNLPNNYLQSLLAKYQSLNTFCERIKAQYFDLSQAQHQPKLLELKHPKTGHTSSGTSSADNAKTPFYKSHKFWFYALVGITIYFTIKNTGILQELLKPMKSQPEQIEEVFEEQYHENDITENDIEYE